MPRIARLIVKGAPKVYHVMSRTALDVFVLGDIRENIVFIIRKFDIWNSYRISILIEDLREMWFQKAQKKGSSLTHFPLPFKAFRKEKPDV